jgi:hypothetical protein
MTSKAGAGTEEPFFKAIARTWDRTGPGVAARAGRRASRASLLLRMCLEELDHFLAPDGDWDVVCKDGRHEVAKLADVLGDKICAPPVVCVKQCSARYDNGNCQTFAPDFCGPAAQCATKCAARYDNGNCSMYAADECGPASACVTKCAARYDNGNCSTYGADFCAVGTPTCVARCTARYDNGNCSAYGADFCKAGSTPPTCTQVCTERYDNGNCKTYGADSCQ